jgi:hypothetical protein
MLLCETIFAAANHLPIEGDDKRDGCDFGLRLLPGA